MRRSIACAEQVVGVALGIGAVSSEQRTTRAGGRTVLKRALRRLEPPKEQESLSRRHEAHKQAYERYAADAQAEDQAVELLDGLADKLGDDLVPHIQEAFRSHISEGDKIAWGMSRVVIIKEDKVIKFPYNAEGMIQSVREERVYQEYPDDPEEAIPMARIESKSTSEGMGYQECENVEPVFFDSMKESPRWVMSVDCAQAGFTKDGRLVAYDL